MTRQDALWNLQHELDEHDKRKDLTPEFFQIRADLCKKIDTLKKSMAEDDLLD
ncbi:hypothetical protein PP939_gp125 [Rhizobium phage RL38J1]|uniref:Uncharacterized protein n=2 Tax=Innesvirus TaxID=3044739 RepID=A0A6B9JDQ0_9CAUD|nr:hypothetical protein PP939_gp125 [Rhizobium phage RL38J1]YP_010662859.1 hypothetical protein PP940_gp181 [Rhizobium phage RL2RES]QGZ14091.1 hypothetical protein RL38J1_125 [Rhizobium phage RL38J1]QGZ14356.1 hypothetical protein RL2RES_181 [Rhizobium phage RL2RES]